MSFFQPAPEPKSLLGYYRILSPSAGVRVSPICLGTMNFGESWKERLGECSKETSFEILDYYYDMGGNFLDTANNYQDEESEQWLGEWMEKRGNRDQMVVATKFTTGYRTHSRATELQSNFTGNSAKSLHTSLNASLKKLKTDYVDVLYVHWWDYTTSIPELMQSLNAIVNAGKVLYLGVSDTPAWIVSKANEYARNHGLRQFVVYQGRWSAASRDFERDIIPMCEAEGMGLAPWGVLGRGNFKTEEQRKSGEGRNTGGPGPSEVEIKVAKVLEKIANDHNTIMTSVALAYVMHKTPNVFPICGGRKVDHLKGNIEALGLRLSTEEMNEIDSASSFAAGFPHDFLFAGKEYNSSLTASSVYLTSLACRIDVPEKQKPIIPRSQ